MKKLSSILSTIFLLALLSTGCDKQIGLENSANGTAVVLSTTTTTFNPTAADSTKSNIVLSWTNPNYAQDASLYKFVIQVDSTGRNFSKAVSTTVIGTPFKYAFVNKTFNALLLQLGFAFNVAYNVDVRIISSYGNNNEQLTSNTIKILATPFKTPAKIAPPSSNTLYLVGDASQGGWTNPVPLPSQQFAKIDETTYTGVFNLKGGKQYLVLPKNGEWGKYSIANSTQAAESGDFGIELPQNFNGPLTDGWYNITLNFQTGKYTVTPTQAVPDKLFIVGDATPGGWSNPVPLPSQEFTRLNACAFQINVLALNADKSYLLLPVNGAWDNKYGGTGKLSGALLTNGAVPGSNTPSPSEGGNYKINVNFGTLTYTLTKQ